MTETGEQAVDSRIRGTAFVRRICDRSGCGRPLVAAFTKQGLPGEFCSDLCLRKYETNLNSGRVEMTEDMIQDEDDFTVDDSPIDSGDDAQDDPTPAKKAKAKAKVKAKGDTSVKTANTATAKATKPAAKSTKSAAPAKKATKVAAKPTKAAKPAAKQAAAHASNGNGNGRAAFPRDAVIHMTKKFNDWTPKGSRLPDKIKLIKDGMTVGEFLDKRREKGFGSGSRPLFLAQEAGAITIK